MVQKHSVREKQTWTRMETGQADIRLKIYVDDRSNNTNFMQTLKGGEEGPRILGLSNWKRGIIISMRSKERGLAENLHCPREKCFV